MENLTTTRTFETGAGKLARTLARRYNVPVYLTKGVSCTDGKAIYINKQYAEGGIIRSNVRSFFDGLLDHEIGHMLYTFTTSPSKKQLNKVVKEFIAEGKANKYIWNLLEDVRINCMMARDFPGSKVHIEYTLLTTIEDNNRRMKTGEIKEYTASIWSAICLYLFFEAHYRYFSENEIFLIEQKKLEDNYFVVKVLSKMKTKRFNPFMDVYKFTNYMKELMGAIIKVIEEEKDKSPMPKGSDKPSEEECEEGVSGEGEKGEKENDDDDGDYEDYDDDEKLGYEGDEEDDDDFVNLDDPDEPESPFGSESGEGSDFEDEDDYADDDESDDEVERSLEKTLSEADDDDLKDMLDDDDDGFGSGDDLSDGEMEDDGEIDYDDMDGEGGGDGKNGWGEDDDEDDERFDVDEAESLDFDKKASELIGDNEDELAFDEEDLKDKKEYSTNEEYIVEHYNRLNYIQKTFLEFGEGADFDWSAPAYVRRKDDVVYVKRRSTRSDVQADYDKLLNKLSKSIHRQAVEFEQRVYSKSLAFEYRDKEGEEFDILQVAKIAKYRNAGFQETEFKINKSEINFKSIAVQLLIDLSGSMYGSANRRGYGSGRKCDVAQSIAIYFAEVFKRCNVNYEALGFAAAIDYEHKQYRTAEQNKIAQELSEESSYVKGSVDPNEDSRVTYDVEQSGKTVNVERVGSDFKVEPVSRVDMYGRRGIAKGGRRYSNTLKVFKDFNEKDNKHLSRITKETGGENTDGAALEYAGLRLLRQEADRKMMFVVSDGMPTGYSTSSAAYAHLHFVIERLRQLGLEIYCIGFDHVEKFYGRDFTYLFTDHSGSEIELEKAIINVITEKIIK